MTLRLGSLWQCRQRVLPSLRWMVSSSGTSLPQLWLLLLHGTIFLYSESPHAVDAVDAVDAVGAVLPLPLRMPLPLCPTAVKQSSFAASAGVGSVLTVEEAAVEAKVLAGVVETAVEAKVLTEAEEVGSMAVAKVLAGVVEAAVEAEVLMSLRVCRARYLETVSRAGFSWIALGSLQVVRSALVSGSSSRTGGCTRGERA